TYSSGTRTFVTCPVSGLIASVRPSGTARHPSSTIEVSPPACPSNVEPAGAPPLQAAIHSGYTPGEPGYFWAGGWATMSACFAGSSTLGSSPYVPATSLPSVPIHNCPPPRSNGQGASSATSGGRAGYRLPSRHTTVASAPVAVARMRVEILR